MPIPLHDVNVKTKKATLALACFWEPDAFYGSHKGVIRTRVGYSGGTKPNPTYKDLGDHTETIEIEYDPNEVSYEELLDVFWNNHDPTAKTTLQYTSIIFYHDEEQKALAEKTLKEQQKRHSAPIVTKILPVTTFHDAEDYHQKYRLQQHPALMKAINLEPGPKVKSSYLAAKLNGYVVGRGGVAQFDKEVNKLGLDENTIKFVRELVVKNEGRALVC
ncbi:Peptide methionine sulfoxide reductase [Blattella germanica]|nr:Peptide methionine sulfoxide reductase [Blattella germanica]